MIPTSADEPVWPDDAIEVGRVLDAWGIKGAIKVKPFASDPQALFSSRRWFLKPAEVDATRPDPLAGRRAVSVPAVLRVASAQPHGEVIVVQSLDIPDRNAAEALRGVRIFVSRTSFPTPKADEYYWIDLIGLNVVNREGQVLGVVDSLIDTGPHSVLRVCAVAGETPVEEERLIPFVAAYIDDVSLAERLIRVDWGLDY
jgi:16S rRNA processing protein RimM